MAARKKVNKKSTKRGSKKKVARKSVSKKKVAKKSSKKKASKKTVTKKKVSKKKPAKKKPSKKKASKKKAAKKSSKKASKKKVSKKKPSKKKISKKKASKKKVVKKTSKKKVSKKAPAKAKAKKAEPAPEPQKKVIKKIDKQKILAGNGEEKRLIRNSLQTPLNPADVLPPLPRKRRKVSNDQLIHGITPYLATKGEEYMNDAQLEHFCNILTAWKNELMQEVDRTVHHMQDEASNFPDPNDRATQESEFGLELRTRDRERKLLKKIAQAIGRTEDGSYGYCDETGEEIGLKRLEARPVATLSVEAQERREVSERQYRDQDDHR
jgi:DnaK suppressor protein